MNSQPMRKKAIKQAQRAAKGQPAAVVKALGNLIYWASMDADDSISLHDDQAPTTAAVEIIRDIATTGEARQILRSYRLEGASAKGIVLNNKEVVVVALLPTKHGMILRQPPAYKKVRSGPQLRPQKVKAKKAPLESREVLAAG